jgi:hypothetical protein
MPTTPTPNVLTDPGFLFWAPLGSAEPTHTVSLDGKFTDAWPAAWINLGATEDGSTFNYSTTVEAIRVAELFDPVKQVTTERGGSFAFNLADYTASNLKRAFNGGALTVTAATASTGQLNRFDPPNPGEEIRAMIGWESLDSTVRLIARQTLNSGDISMAFRKAPDIAVVPCEFQFEKPSGAQPFSIWTAGTARG